MSSYISKAKNPKTEKIEDAQFLDDFYGLHKYGVRFDDGNVYPVSEIEIPVEKCQSESIEWEESLSEYGQLHSEDCCVNFPEDSRACDVDTGVVDCCENMRVIANFVTAEKEKSRKEENDRWVEMAEAHRPHCSATGNKMLTSMMGKKNRISKAITTAVAKEKEKGLAEKKELLKIMTNEKTL